MACDFYSTCTNDEWAEPAQWGFPFKCCKTHFDDRLKNEVAGKMPGRVDLDDTFLQDYTKLFLMMTSPGGQETVRLRLRALAEKMQKKKDSQASEDFYVKLSAILAEYEEMAWFPPSNEVFLGFLPGFQFQNSIAKGIMAKDPGAGVNHGDFTHRLQWHAIISVITNEFTVHKRPGWNHTPLELYTNLGSPKYQAGNIWFALFDDASKPDFRSPDILHGEIRHGKDYGLLQIAVVQRHKKRLDEYKAQLNDGESPASKVMSTHPQITDLINPDGAVSAKAGEAYARRKIGNQRQRKVVGLQWAPKWAKADGAGKFKPMLLLSERIRRSNGGLNKLEHEYSPVLGPVSRPGMEEWVVDL